MSLLRKIHVRIRGRAEFALLRARMGLRLTWSDRLALLLGTLDEWREARYALAAAEMAASRRAICERSPCWATRPFPHCSVCGCTAAKFRLASAKCPRGRW